MKHVTAMTLPKQAACNELQSYFVGKIAEDASEYSFICQDKGSGK
jgi:hypothetical protein